MGTSDDPELAAEFGFIRRHFRALAGPGALNLTDDAAVFTPPAGRQIVVAADAMVEGLHFLPSDPPETIGRKLLRCNLSDLAAMDATPLGYLMTVSRPARRDDSWFSAFCDGLARDQAAFGLSLFGGDTTGMVGGPDAPLVLSLTILGHVAPGAALLRSGARAGDGLWVTGTIGDGALGLGALQGRVADPDGYFADRYRLPRPRLGMGLGGIASACLDVSDGLVQDAGHLARESGVGLEIEALLVPLAPQARALGSDILPLCLTGGDDYELLFTAPVAHEPAIRAACARAAVPVTRIGHVTGEYAGVRVLDAAGRAMEFAKPGWSHL